MHKDKSKFILYPHTNKGRNVFRTQNLPFKNTLKATQHTKLNTKSNPCKESHDYSFQNCIYAKMISKIGCQPYWLDYIITGIKNCSKASQLDSFLKKMADLNGISSAKELADEYKCLKPCNYMEYKVLSNKTRSGQ